VNSKILVMKLYNLFSFILLSSLLSNCSEDKKKLFSIDESKFKLLYHLDDTILLHLKNDKNKSIDSVAYFINDKKAGAVKGNEVLKFDLATKKLGYQNLKAIAYYDGDNAETATRIEIVSRFEPKLLNYKIVNTFPHDTTSFTEGLEFMRDTLIESTGLRGKSKLLKTDYKTGKILKSLNLEPQDFGEGITFINNKIYQLTWEEKKGFIYNVDTWKLEKTFNYDKNIEGWGMTNDGKHIYHNDKTERIWKMNPDTQKMVDSIFVYSGNDKIVKINELEWINGKIYSNVWQKDAIVIINPENGVVENVVDLSGLRKLVTNKYAEVLNGIAYNTKTKTIFVTGKNWDKMFEIKITP
jgi:glutaminyl-peptide cyclotransferase